MRHTVAYAWYRFRRTMRSEMSYFLSVVLLVGAVGGLALGAIEAAWSTESSFADLVASSRVPQLFVFDGVINPGIGLDSAYNPRLLRKLSRAARRGTGREHGRAQPGSADPPGEAIARASYFPGRRGECRGTRLQRGSHQNRRRADGRSSRGGRGRARCGQRQDAGLPRWRGDPGGMGDKCPDDVRQLRPEPTGPGSSAGDGKARRDRRRTGDDPFPGPGQRQRPVAHALHARPDQQAPRLLQQRHGQRARRCAMATAISRPWRGP